MKIQKSSDGTIKISFDEGYHSVIIPTKDNKFALCVSCQIGCPIGCKFCFSGKSFTRSLTAKEIIDQFEETKKIIGKNPDTVVFMGMGEPSLNLEAVEEAADFFHSEGMAYNHITISTSCIKNLDKLADLPYAIAISLHSPFDSVRKKLINSSIKVKDIVKFARRVSEKRKKRTILVQYSMMEDINDRDKDLKKLISLKWPRRTMFNLIEFNELAGMKQSDKERFIKFKEEIIKAGKTFAFPKSQDTSNKRKAKVFGWKCFIRQARGKDIDAACGMLS